MKLAVKVIGGFAAAFTASLLALLLLVAGTLQSAPPDAGQGVAAGAVCATRGPVPGLSAAAAANARVITAAAVARGGRPAALVGITVALAESGLVAVPFGHLDSIGLFQQRPSWGSAAQRMDPAISANLFLDRLLKVPGWQGLPPQVAAQAVQASAYPDGSNYLAQLPRAVRVLSTITGTPATACAAKPSAVLPASLAGAPAQARLIAFGRHLQRLGFTVSEHKAFGGVDVSELTKIDTIIPLARQYGLRSLWKIEAHWDHSHHDVSTGPDMIGS